PVLNWRPDPTLPKHRSSCWTLRGEEKPVLCAIGRVIASNDLAGAVDPKGLRVRGERKIHLAGGRPDACKPFDRGGHRAAGSADDLARVGDPSRFTVAGPGDVDRRERAIRRIAQEAVARPAHIVLADDLAGRVDPKRERLRCAGEIDCRKG